MSELVKNLWIVGITLVLLGLLVLVASLAPVPSWIITVVILYFVLKREVSELFIPFDEKDYQDEEDKPRQFRKH